MKELLALRKARKKKKPTFRRQNAGKKKEVGSTYRRAKGLQSKMRLSLKSYQKKIQIGYKAPALVRGLDPSGLLPVLVYSLGCVAGIDKKTQGAVIGSSVGKKKKIDLLKKAEELGVTVLNVKDVKGFIAQIEKAQKDKKEAGATKQKKREDKRKELEKEAKKKEEKGDDLSEKIEKEEQKKELDKLLTKKE